MIQRSSKDNSVSVEATLKYKATVGRVVLSVSKTDHLYFDVDIEASHSEQWSKKMKEVIKPQEYYFDQVSPRRMLTGLIRTVNEFSADQAGSIVVGFTDKNINVYANCGREIVEALD